MDMIFTKKTIVKSHTEAIKLLNENCEALRKDLEFQRLDLIKEIAPLWDEINKLKRENEKVSKYFRVKSKNDAE